MSTSDDVPILKPSDLIAHLRASGQLPDFPRPHTIIFAPQKSLADYVLHRHSVKQIKGFLGEFYLLKRTNGQIALSTGFGIGAPAIASLTDEFAALGVTQFALIGLAGGLQPELTAGSLVVAAGAIRGEGVSRHYLPPGSTVEASAEMVGGISQILAGKNRPHTTGLTWTTDAPFRELKREVLEYQRHGILTVEMEAAGLLAVAKAHRLPAAAMFSIADQLSGGEWRMADDFKPAQKGLFVLFEAAFEYLTAR
jgi:uridine phosphorylase